jgi:hypothetical protein
VERIDVGHAGRHAALEALWVVHPYEASGVSHPARGPVRRTGIDGKANRRC